MAQRTTKPKKRGAMPPTKKRAAAAGSYADLSDIMGPPTMSRLSHRANYDVHTVREKPLVLYEDHRSLFFVLWYALHAAKVIERAPLLIYFDGHDDAKPVSGKALARLRELRAGAPTAREVFDFVEWELSPLDDDWLLAAMELGLVGDAICVGASCTPNLDSHADLDPEAVESARRMRELFSGAKGKDEPHRVLPGRGEELCARYEDHGGDSHRIWLLPHLWKALATRGALEDAVRASYFGSLWDALDWDPSSGWFKGTTGLTPIVLDVDLDCFAISAEGGTFAWPPRFFKRFTERSDSGQTALDFLAGLEHRVAFRTVARESPYCGGTADSENILASLDHVLWNGELLDL
ncbi:MAG: hypothetical protein KIT84_11220 [Labilithrix sp.]|nr:hypothetical protein [Labilithrix sp.]MCW5811579.1 hypothetical protein [Labilithrix sp.]